MVNPNSNVTARKFPRLRTATRLPEALNQRLNAYALCAGAAGVAVLACAMPAEGASICKKLSVQLAGNSSFALYLPGNAPAPFNIAQSTNSTFRSGSTTGRGTFMWWNRGFFTPNSGGAKVLLAKGEPADVAFGAEIGPGGEFGRGASYGLLFTYGKGHFSMRGGGTLLKHRGNLSLVQDSYIGFKFLKSGEAHYGWVRLAVSLEGTKRKHSVTHVLGYGYEVTPNTAIAAGGCTASASGSGRSDGTLHDPPMHNSIPAKSAPNKRSQSAALGMLALGSDGLVLWRKQE
jgi:hypothetical protein